MEKTMTYINKKISDLCDDRGWSLYTLSEKTGIPYSSLNSSINRNSPPKIDALEKICTAFGISLAQFFLNDEQIEILGEKEKELIARFRRLSEEKQAALLELLNT